MNNGEIVSNPTRTNLDQRRQQIFSSVASMSHFQRRCFLRRQYGHRWRYLFKYRKVSENDNSSIEKIKNILLQSELWLSSPADFNDPFDTSAKIIFEGTGAQKRERFDLLIKRMEPKISWKKRKEYINSIMAAHGNSFHQKLQEMQNALAKSLGVCSFAGDARNILMWSHYANNHSGICLQFNRAIDPQSFLQAVQVDYTDRYPVIDWMVNSTGENIKSVLSKHAGWSYERESRIIIPMRANSPLTFRAEALCAIIFGCKSTSQTVTIVKTILDERVKLGMPTVALYKANMHSEKYELHLSRV